MATVSRLGGKASKASTYLVEFKYKKVNYKIDYTLTFWSDLPDFVKLKDPTVYIDHNKVADRIFQIAGIANPGGDKWEEVRDALALEIPGVIEFPV
jgi:hypothetical protein